MKQIIARLIQKLKHIDLKKGMSRFLMALVIFIFGIWRLDEVEQPIVFSDEYGYWANTSFFLGEDLSSLTSRIGYYSYGYSLMLLFLRLYAKLSGWWWYGGLYQKAVVWNACMLVISFWLATKIASRYFDKIHWFIRDLLCCVVFLYSSNIFYAHLTMTETAIVFCFWVFLYIMMKLTDKPSIANHAAMALISVYMYTIHQRTIAVLITAVLIVCCMAVVGKSRLKQTMVFWGIMIVSLTLHSMIKGALQSYYYLGNGPMEFSEMLRLGFNQKMLVFVLAGVCTVWILYMIQHKKYRLLSGVAILGIIGIIAVIWYLLSGKFTIQPSHVDERISNNDFSGQWGKILGIFSIPGLMRLGISITGKWFYMASASGLIICWGLKDLIKHFSIFIIHGLRRACSLLKRAWKQPQGAASANVGEMSYDSDRIWLFGVCLVTAGTFMIAAIYKEGLFKNDDLVHGRYNEFLMGILLIYSFVSLLKDKHWLRTFVISLVLYFAAGGLCQYTLNELKRTEFELCHSPMFGRVFWNWQVPVGKIKEMMQYVLPLGIIFIIMVKGFANKFPKVQMVRVTVALLVPAVVWGYLASSIIDHYVVSVNQKQKRVSEDISYWIDVLSWGQDWPIYYFEDTKDFRHAEGFQYKLLDKPITMTKLDAVSFDEDAFYIMDTGAAQSKAIQENCEVVVQKSQFTLLIHKEQELMNRWQWSKH